MTVNHWPKSQICAECTHGELVLSDAEACKYLCAEGQEAETPGCEAAFEERPAEE